MITGLYLRLMDDPALPSACNSSGTAETLPDLSTAHRPFLPINQYVFIWPVFRRNEHGRYIKSSFFPPVPSLSEMCVALATQRSLFAIFPREYSGHYDSSALERDRESPWRIATRHPNIQYKGIDVVEVAIMQINTKGNQGTFRSAGVLAKCLYLFLWRQSRHDLQLNSRALVVRG